MREFSPELLAFFRTGRKVTYKRGEIILRPGDEPQGVYLIEKGFVKIYALSRHGEERLQVFYTEFDIFPLLWAFKDAVRTSYYEACEPTTLWLVSREQFTAFVSKDAQAANYLLKMAMGLFRVYAGRIDNLLLPNSYDRTAFRVIALTHRFSNRQKDGTYVIDAPITHNDIANSINLSRETTSRAMQRLVRKGIITYDQKRHIVVKDMTQLINIFGPDEIEAIWPRLVRNIKT